MKRRHKPTRPSEENPEWTRETFARSRPAREALPEILGDEVASQLLRPRGRPPTGNAKTAISIRLPRETQARWKATGPGWQTRMADTLTLAIDAQTR